MLERKGLQGLGVNEQSICRLWQAPRLGVGPPQPSTAELQLAPCGHMHRWAEACLGHA